MFLFASLVSRSHNWQSGVAFAALLIACATPALSAERKHQTDGNQPALVQADRMAYDENTHIVTATGHVEISQGDSQLRADEVTYNQDTDVIHASGHVVMLQPDGQTLFAAEAAMTEDMKQGFVEKVGVLFDDNSRLAAQDARRYEGRYLIADRAVYSPCDLCAEHPQRAPLWQLKGGRVTHDNVKKDVIYRDATLEFEGIPVLYMPYFSHPDPTVKRRQGFLTPYGGYNQNLGTFGRVPYYIDINPNTDAVISPTFSTKDKAQFAGEVRHRFRKGIMQWDGSVTRTDLVDEFGVDQGQQWRGHLFGTTRFDLDSIWRTGADVAFTSDKSYLPRYSIAADNVLRNRAFLEGFKGRNTAVVNSYYFQDLRPGSPLSEPFVAPEVSFSAFGEPGKTLGGRWSLDGGLLITSRNQDVAPSKQGPNTRRFDLGGGWQRELVSSTGLVTTLSGLARMDAYWADNVVDPNNAGFVNISKVRHFAQADLNLRYPLGRRGDGYQQIVEPIATLSLAPEMDSDWHLPNEDSLDVEFDETNLFAPNRFTGIDRLEGGTRAAYGLRHALIGDNGARIEFLGGQVYRLKKDTSFPGGSGLRNELSDYVGRLDFTPGRWFDAGYGFRLDSSSYRFQRQEIKASGGVDLFRPYVNYLSVVQTEATTGINSAVEEITFGFSSAFAKYWTFSAFQTRALQPQAGTRLTGLGLAYGDECLQFGVTAQRDNTSRQDLNAGNSILFHLYLKNVGGVHTDTTSTPTPFMQTQRSK